MPKVVNQGYRIRPYPPGRIRWCRYSGTSCRDFGQLSRVATIVESLRDKAIMIRRFAGQTIVDTAANSWSTEDGFLKENIRGLMEDRENRSQ